MHLLSSKTRTSRRDSIQSCESLPAERATNLLGQSASKRHELPLSGLWPPRAFGRGCLKFELPADLLGILLGKGSRNPPQDRGEQKRFGRRSASEHGWEGSLTEPYLVRSTLPNISESGTPLGLRGTLNELVCGKVSIFENGEENHLEWTESRNIHFGLTSDDEFCVILS